MMAPIQVNYFAGSVWKKVNGEELRLRPNQVVLINILDLSIPSGGIDLLPIPESSRVIQRVVEFPTTPDGEFIEASRRKSIESLVLEWSGVELAGRIFQYRECSPEPAIEKCLPMEAPQHIPHYDDEFVAASLRELEYEVRRGNLTASTIIAKVRQLDERANTMNLPRLYETMDYLLRIRSEQISSPDADGPAPQPNPPAKKKLI